MPERGDLAELLRRLGGTRVLCIGDVMLDRFIYGAVDRISPEAPIPVLRVEREIAMLGGAGNVVRNLAALGVESCFMTVIGRDAAAGEVTRLVAREATVEPHLLVEPQRRTTIKQRFIAAGQQLLRADTEQIDAPLETTGLDLATRAEHDLQASTAVVLSDYAKGVLTDAVLAKVIGAARRAGRPVVVDPKGENYRRYAGATVLTPNRRELAEATRMPVDGDEAIVAAARSLIHRCTLDAVLVTRSQDGMTVVASDGAVHHLKAEAREVYDVSGAGDTVAAVVAAALAAGAGLLDAARLANIAAGVVVAKTGTAVAYPAEILEALQHDRHHLGGGKASSREAAVAQAEEWRRRGLRVGFTNGCFDLLHLGHIHLLAQAKAACDRLIVGLNSDASVRRLKGESRPVKDENERAAIMASLEAVDLVTVFEEDTPLALIEALRPDVLVKGADYTVETTVGAREVQSWGGKVVLADLAAGYSTTGTIRRLAG
ncbi:MAG: D-glycero-beta-D-manno-heptose-7-phosphate kinase [Thalassobaculales bacterium]